MRPYGAWAFGGGTGGWLQFSVCVRNFVCKWLHCCICVVSLRLGVGRAHTGLRNALNRPCLNAIFVLHMAQFRTATWRASHFKVHPIMNSSLALKELVASGSEGSLSALSRNGSWFLTPLLHVALCVVSIRMFGAQVLIVCRADGTNEWPYTTRGSEKGTRLIILLKYCGNYMYHVT